MIRLQKRAGLSCVPRECFAAAVEGWVFATKAGFETLYDCRMAFGTSEQMREACAGGVVGVGGLIPMVEEIFDGYASVW